MTPSGRRPLLRLHSADVDGGRQVSPRGNTAAPARAGSLRLAGKGEQPPATQSHRAREVAGENRLASGMSPDDARWIFARRVAESLEGGTTAILTPEKRRRLMATSRRVGLRDFDASLVIALVQDARRSGKGALNPRVEHALLMVRPADEPRRTPEWVRFLIAAAILGALMAWGMARWVSGT